MKHGGLWDYRKGCRCEPCRVATSAYLRKYRKRLAGRLVPSAATTKRVQELLDEGFTRAQIARRIGIKCARLRIVRKRIRKSTEDKVRVFYETIMAGA